MNDEETRRLAENDFGQGMEALTDENIVVVGHILSVKCRSCATTFGIDRLLWCPMGEGDERVVGWFCPDCRPRFCGKPIDDRPIKGLWLGGQLTHADAFCSRKIEGIDWWAVEGVHDEDGNIHAETICEAVQDVESRDDGPEPGKHVTVVGYSKDDLDEAEAREFVGRIINEELHERLDEDYGHPDAADGNMWRNPAEIERLIDHAAAVVRANFPVRRCTPVRDARLCVRVAG